MHLNTLNSRGWEYGSTLTLLPPKRFPQIWESLLKSKMMSVWKRSHYAIVEAVEPFKLHPTSMSYIYSSVWTPWTVVDGHMAAHSYLCHHRGFPRFGRAGAEILDDVSVEMIPLRYRWGCKTFQSASHIHDIHILGLWKPETVVDGDMAAHSHRYHHRGFPRFGRVYWNPRWCKCGNDPSAPTLRL